MRFDHATGQRLLALLFALSCLLMPNPAMGQDRANGPDGLDQRIATAWADLTLELTRTTPGFTPPVAARAFGYFGVTLWEALAPALPGARSLAGQINDFPPLPQPAAAQSYAWPLVVNSALAGITRRMFASGGMTTRNAIDGLETSIRKQYAAGIDRDAVRRSQAHGRLIAAAIYAWSRTDGGHEGQLFNTPEDYTWPVDSTVWTPTPPAYAEPLQPDWGQNRPFVLTSGAECAPPPPPAYDETPGSPQYLEAMEVYTTVQNLTAAQREIALYWADDPGLTATPPGHSLAIATAVLRTEDATLAQAAETYARLGIAMADAFVACWNAKSTYQRMRPITYIQRVIDPNWNTPAPTDPVLTPPFPEYTSGHATEAGAAARVLEQIFGADYAFVDHSQTRLGFAPRVFSSFMAAAEEAAVSRLYGGIHYRSANENGLAQGICIGDRVLKLSFWK